MTASKTGDRSRGWALARLGVCAAAVALHLPSLLHPILLFDDFHILLASWTWADTRANLWVPMNEHCWPLTRLLTAVVVEASGHRQTWLPLAAAVPPRLRWWGRCCSSTASSPDARTPGWPGWWAWRCSA